MQDMPSFKNTWKLQVSAKTRLRPTLRMRANRMTEGSSSANSNCYSVSHCEALYSNNF